MEVADLLSLVMALVYLTLGAYVLAFRPLTRVLALLGGALVANGIMYAAVKGTVLDGTVWTLAGIATVVLFALFYALYPRPIRPWSLGAAVLALTFVWAVADLRCAPLPRVGVCNTMHPGAMGNLLLLTMILVRLVELPRAPALSEDAGPAARFFYLAPLGVSFAAGGFAAAWTVWGWTAGGTFPTWMYTSAPLHTSLVQVLAVWILPAVIAALCIVRWRWWLPAAVLGAGVLLFLPGAAADALEGASVRALLSIGELLTPWLLLYAQATWAPFEGEPGGRRTTLVITGVSAVLGYASAFVLALILIPDPTVAALAGSALGLVAAVGVAAVVLPRARRAALLRSFGEPRPGAAGTTLAPGARVLDRYEIVRLLAEGGQGRVYEALDLGRRGARVVLKATTSEEATREARILRDLRHPNVVAFVDVVEVPGLTLLVLDYAHGGNLRGLLARRGGALPPAEALALAHGILAGLAEAHARGVAHRDVKPENVLLNAEGMPMLADFGAARDARPGDTIRVAGLGTLAYLSPEQLRGEPGDARSDVYAAAVVFHELLAGRAPIALADDDFLARRAILTQPPTLAIPPEVARLAPVLERALAKDPAARYPDAGAMLEALGAAIGAGIIAASR